VILPLKYERRIEEEIVNIIIMGQVLSLPFKLVKTTNLYVTGLFHYLWGGGRYNSYGTGTASTFRPLHPLASDSDERKLFKQYARIHLYSLASTFYLYDKPHYRKGSYRDDMIDNLRNVAVPGTGVPLAWAVRPGRLLGMLPFALCAYPAASLIAALHLWISTRGAASISAEYETRLLAPDDWFSYWRHNCNVVGLHALLNDMPADYEMENKWEFLQAGEARGVPVSPFLKSPAIVVKHRNEEGGMGIYFYKNATDGGDWIIQERIDNSDWVASLLPPDAPLSTFRVITCSRSGLADPQAPPSPLKRSDVVALSCVFRAGRAGAATDHDSILFDVDVETGLIRRGTTNANWYRLWYGAFRCPWRSSSKNDCTHHPDGGEKHAIPVTGQRVPDIASILALVENSHHTLCPAVPLAGWDVVLSADKAHPVCLLEVNLSCNFFRGSFDKKVRRRPNNGHRQEQKQSKSLCSRLRLSHFLGWFVCLFVFGGLSAYLLFSFPPFSVVILSTTLGLSGLY
jgi:hypothetical protein